MAAITLSSSVVYLYWCWALVDHWLQAPQGGWFERFHANSDPDPGAVPVLVDRGRLLAGQPPLLTTRRWLSLLAAREHWRLRLSQGWRPCPAQWGTGR